MTFRKIASVTLLALMMGACSGQNGLSGQDVGSIVGGVGGGLVGSMFGQGTGQILAGGAGAVIGALAGDYAGKSYDNSNSNN